MTEHTTEQAVQKFCEYCNTPFTTHFNATRFCSHSCRAHFYHEVHTGIRSAPIPQTITCEYCGKAFLPRRSTFAKYCSNTCSNHANRYLCPRGKRPKRNPIEPRLWPQINKDAPNGCWEWTGALTENGYGYIGYQGDNIMVHRLVWELTNGPIPDGHLTCHKCDVNYPPGDKTYRRCCNPEHLFVGTHTDNMQDMHNKQRHAHGETHGNSKLGETDISEIRRRYKEGVSQSVLAREYGVSQTLVSMVVLRKIWAHIP